MKIKILNSKERKKLVAELEEQFGVSELPALLVETGKQKVRGFSGSMTRDEILELSEIANVEIVGLYLFKKEDAGYRISLDGTHVLAGQIKKRIVEINDEQFAEWIRGKDLVFGDTGDSKIPRGVVVVRHGEDFVGTALSNGEKIFNFVPKERRIRNG